MKNSKPRCARARIPEIEEGFFILAATLITYSVTEIAEGYGFLAVFVAAVVAARSEETHVDNKQESYEAIDQVEQAILGIFLIAFGGITATGGLGRFDARRGAIGGSHYC